MRPVSDDNGEKLERLSALGLSQEDAGHILGISPDTIQRRFSEEWARGKAKANAKIASCLFEKAINGDTACLCFWAKTQMRWRETQHVDMTVAAVPLSQEQIDAIHRATALRGEAVKALPAVVDVTDTSVKKATRKPAKKKPAKKKPAKKPTKKPAKRATP